MNQYLSDLRLFSRDARLFLIAVTIFAFGVAVPGVFGALYFDALGFDRAFIGLTNAAALIGGAITLPVAMWTLDRLGRRRAMLLGLVQNWIFWGASISVTNGSLVIALLFISGFGNVLYGLTVVPLLAESSTPKERTALFSSYEGFSTLAIFLGSLVATGLPAFWGGVMGVAADSAVAYRAALLSSFLVRVLGLIPLLQMSHQRHESHAEHGVESDPDRERVFRFLNPRNLISLRTPWLAFAVPYALIHVAGSLIVPFMTLFLRSNFGASDGVIGTTQGLVNLSGGLVAALAPLAVARVGRVWAVAGGCALVAVLTFGIGVSSALVMVVVIIVLRAGIANAIVPVYRAFTIDKAPVAEYTIVSLLLQLSSNIGPAIAPPLSGLAQRQFGLEPMFAACAVLYVLSAVLFAWVMKRAKTRE